MEVRKTRNLVIILVLLAAVIYTLWPNNPGIHIGSFDRSLKAQLGLDLRGGMRVLLEADLPQDTPVTAQQLNDAKTILENRSNALGVGEVNFTTAGGRRLVGEFPGLTNTEQVINVLKQTGQLAFVPLGKTPLPDGTQIQVDYTNPADPAAPGASTEAAPAAVATPAAQATPAATQTAAQSATQTAPAENIAYRPLITGANLQAVSVTRDKLGKYAVSFELKADATQRFAQYSSGHIGDYLAIVLDNKVISAPVIESAITQGQGQITGNYTAQTANDLAIQLRYGSLPVPFKVAESRAVGATLGQDSINKSVQAGVIGLLLVMIFMAVYYRLPGIVADLALLVYAGTTFALFKLIPVTLTLPGIAGFVLSLGVAVDANVLIFSRLKEELRAGRSLHQSIDLAWQRAWPSIRDSNISTMITCVILFIFGSTFGASMVRGFSVNLFLGVLISLFTAIIVTRTFLHIALDSLKLSEHPGWFGL
jgi:preprotein translocase subunit SecD